MDGLTTYTGVFSQFRLAEVGVRRIHKCVNHVSDALVLSENPPPTWILIPEFCHPLFAVLFGLLARHRGIQEPMGVKFVGRKSKKTVQEQLDVLIKADILAIYEHPPNKDKRGLPWKFYGFTEYGVTVLGDFNYLKGVPMARAVHQKTRKPGKIERHETAPRPSLPEPVRETFEFEETAG